jgi:hypothetical protein
MGVGLKGRERRGKRKRQERKNFNAQRGELPKSKGLTVLNIQVEANLCIQIEAN